MGKISIWDFGFSMILEAPESSFYEMPSDISLSYAYRFKSGSPIFY